MAVLTPAEGFKLIVEGKAATGLNIQGRLELKQKPEAVLNLPDALTATALDLAWIKELMTLPAKLHCYELNARSTGLIRLPSDLQVDFKLDLSDCVHLESLPDGFTTGVLILRNCVSLTRLPDNLNVDFLDISGCINLTELPETLNIHYGNLNASGCARLRNLPAKGVLASLNLEGCAIITEIPEGLHITNRIEVAGSGLTTLPERLRLLTILWRDVPVSYEIAFEPEKITAEGIHAARNIELRRVMLERMGYEQFFEKSAAEEVDQDFDLGGQRRLLKIPIPGDEPLVCVTYACPSTGRRYVTRVPPDTKTCHQAVAWIAGFDNPADYRLIAET